MAHIITTHTESVNSLTPMGYVIVNKEIIHNTKDIGYFYREVTDDKRDSGWRFFTGYETQEFSDNAENFMLYKASKLTVLHPEIASFLETKAPVEFEWNGTEYVEIES
ncbi:immunity protein Imm33 domain-containing protein [Enterovibrio nigricans]|uniref:Immunity protein Imm33 domain-containing protein n=1 Tax=Enterovibrio nigricans DSM 22720 TaxID=1121868 RepID=A0A1T4UBE8_9GAMM|nr:DUF2185 domain-containing protein [Enterovibrio nigricans]PKF51621.1 DUF2185 domain-containing protein [Enterovibrio nigricans]SKA49987.1 hypothetical protein SAMN02745132_01287 [Enterovibrio nigricans DSM 22720]